MCANDKLTPNTYFSGANQTVVSPYDCKRRPQPIRFHLRHFRERSGPIKAAEGNMAQDLLMASIGKYFAVRINGDAPALQARLQRWCGRKEEAHKKRTH
jgi:hypothetical protein